MMSQKTAKELPADIFEEYRAKFGVMDTFGMPDDMTSERLTFLMKKALQEGKPIDYKEEGWESASDDVLF